MNIVERLKAYVETTARDNEQPNDDQSNEANEFCHATLWKMYPDKVDYGLAVSESGRDSYPEDLLALMSEDEIELAYAKWVMEERES